MRFRIRIDSDRNDDHFIKFLEKYSSYVLVHHVLPHGNSHYHIYVNDTFSLSIDALRKRIDRYFNVKGSDRSIKDCSEDRINEYVQYLFNQKHGNIATLIKFSNFDEPLLHKLQEQAKDVADDFASRKKVKSVKQQITQYDLAEEVIEGMKNLHKEEYTIEDYTLVAVKVMRKHRKAFCKFSLGRIIMTAMSDESIVNQMRNYFHTM